jgi:adenylate cyclase
MSDVFISYSRKDSDRALQLADQLRASGISVWIDRRRIMGAEQWATEIVEGIRACSTFLLLISSDSIQSDNVLKELSLASEGRKRLLPVDIHPTELPSSFAYPLAGLQRLAISDFDGILRAHKHGVARAAAKDLRKSLIVLPFEDLSPGQDNGWFADGLASELIDSLSHIKSLRLIDRKTSMDLRGFHGKTQEIADALHVRYFIQGSVRKFGDQIKISVSMLDLHTDETLWQDSHKGKFEEVFELQESVAKNVVAALKLQLTSDEEQKLLDRGTQNADAYELYIKAGDYFHRKSREGFGHAVQLWSEAIRLDPAFANAYQSKANALTNIYLNYDRDPKLLIEAEDLVQEALQFKPDMVSAFSVLSMIYLLQGKLAEAESSAVKSIEIAPEASQSHYALGFFFGNTRQYEKAIAPFEQSVRLMPDNLVSLWNLVLACYTAKDLAKQTYWASTAIPYFERHLRLHPDDEYRRVHLAALFYYAGRLEEARHAATALDFLHDGQSLYNIACLWGMLGDGEKSLRVFRNALNAGYRNIPLIKSFLEVEFAPYKGTPEYEEAKTIVVELET